MYFTVDTRTNGFHIWRQRFPDGQPQQLTPSGASEEEGIAMMPDGKSFITAAGAQQSTVWLHDKSGDKQITSEGFSFLPALSPDGKKMYCLRRMASQRSFYSGELWMTDLGTGAERRLFPGLLLEHFSISPDGKKVVFSTERGQEHPGIWIGWLDGVQPPRQLTFGGEYFAFFGKPGEIIYTGNDSTRRTMRMKEDGSDQQPVSDLKVMQVQTVSRDGRWALVGTTPEGTHGERNTEDIAAPLEGGAPIHICATCSVGFGSMQILSPLLSWSIDGKWLYVPLRYFAFGSTKTAAIPTRPGAPPPTCPQKIVSEAEFARRYGARILEHDNIPSGISADRYVYVRRSAKANLFRIYLEP
jgi:hypothetical protein